MRIPRLPRTSCSTYVSLALLFVASARAAETTPAPAIGAETPAQKAERMQWWVDARFGMFIHWGPASLTGAEISMSRGIETPTDVYDNLYKEFNPVKFDAKQFVTVAREAGMKYLVLVTKHADGFAMYATKLCDYNIMNTPLARDVTKELADECRRQGIRFCSYYNIMSWHDLDYLPRGPGDRRPTKDANFENYIGIMKGQLRELIQNYHPSMMWFDGEWDDTWTVQRGQDIYAMLRQLDPAIITNNRLGKGRCWDGFSPPETTVGDFATPEQEIGGFSSDRNKYWENCETICQQWAWKPNDTLKGLKECIDLLVTTAGHDGNFLLNVGPMPDGQIEPRQVERLREIGQWMKQYGNSIYGTRGGPFRPGVWGVSTCKDNTVFIHVLHRPDTGLISLPSDKKVVASRLFGGEDVEVRQTGGRILITVPPPDRQQLDTVIELKLDESG
jgi:alpha-L-fucosidase